MTKQRLIVAFCIWHMFAIGAYLLPTTPGLYGTLHGWSAPYILSLSQWQKWDIFSPDPLRRVTEFQVERNAGDRWDVAARFDFDHLPIWSRAKELKILGRLETDWSKLVPSYLTSLCPKIPQSAGTDLKLVANSKVLPAELEKLKNLSNVRLQVTQRILGTVRCPRPL